MPAEGLDVEPERGDLERVAGDLQDVAKVEAQPSFEGRQMSMVLAPHKQK